MSPSYFPEGRCPVCKEWVILMAAGNDLGLPAGVVAPHNVAGSWREVRPGVREPRRCPGGGQRPQATRGADA